MYSIDGVEIVISVISNDENGVLIDQHQSPHLFVIKSPHEITHRDFFLVIFVLALSLLCSQVYFKQIMIFINYERWCLLA